MNRFLIVGTVLLIAGTFSLWIAWQFRRRTGLPAGRVIYSDTSTWQECSRPLYAPAQNLAGKPDYLVKKWQYVIPVEVKTCQTPAEPYRSHLLQLAAYCLLVEETFGRRPPYGLIHYPDQTFSVSYTPRLEEELLDTLEWMRQEWHAEEVARDHQDPLRCRSCGFATYCDQRLG